ncbi:MAG: TRIC cation channel family protein [Desulfovibrio sp.]|nr:TRIC cation channel family protein [Desulfovibrio sp.]
MSVVFSAAASVEILDGVAAALLAATACVRARNFGAHFTGAMVLGCLCGIACGLSREIFLNGSAGARLILPALPGSALAGAIGGALAARILAAKKDRVFFWLDAASLGLATSLGAILALPGLGVVGAVALALISGLAPSAIRDVCLGDVAMIVDKSWYAAAAALGAVASVAVVIGGLVIDEIAFARMGEYAALFGTGVVVAIRGWKGRKEEV